MSVNDSKKEITWLLREKYQGVESEAFHADCVRLESGEPLGYLIGHVPFLNCNINLDSHPLIPRPETEYWVDNAITAIKTRTNLRDSIPKILDLCAGSGAIGVAIAKAIPNSFVAFLEIDSTHLPTIKKNIIVNLSTDRKVNNHSLPIIQGDLFENITDTFDYILTNPPYIDADAHTVEDSVALYEPHEALFGGNDGMEIINKIISQAPEYLNPGGELWIEHEPFQSIAIQDLGKHIDFGTVVTHPDQYGVLRFSVLTMAQ